MRFALLLIFTLGSTNCVAQAPTTIQQENISKVCTYRLVYQPDSASQNTRTEYTYLMVCKTFSKFESKGFFLRDSLINLKFDLSKPDIAQDYIDKVSVLPWSKFRYSIYKFPASNRIISYDRIGFTTYRIDEPNELFTWKIIPGQLKSIAGFACQKATTDYAGRSYEAWFTREIPLSEGPYKFYGLPGLIVSISDIRRQYSFELVKSGTPSTTATITLPASKIPAASRLALRQGQQDYELGLLDRAAAMGNKVTEEEKKMRRDELKRENNPLELK
jgi:GLPGLI family protein